MALLLCFVSLVDPTKQGVDDGCCVRLRVKDVFGIEELELHSCFFFADVPQSRLHIAAGVGTRECVRVTPLSCYDRSRVEAPVDVEASCSPSPCDIVQKICGRYPHCFKQFWIRDPAPQHVDLTVGKHALQASMDVVPDRESLNFVEGRAVCRLESQLQHRRFSES